MSDMRANMRKYEDREIFAQHKHLMENPHLLRRGRCIDTVAMRYIEFLEAQRLRDERNHKILNSLDKIDMKLSLMTAKTNRLLALRKQYEASVQIALAETSTGDSGVTSQNPAKQTAKFLNASANSRPQEAVHHVNWPPVPSERLDHELMREKREELLWRSSPRHFPAFPSILRSSTVSSVIPTRAADVRNILDGELERYIRKIRSLHETNEVQSVEELDHEQNTSGDLLNVTLSDDGVDFPAEEIIKDRIKPAEIPTLTADVASKIDAHKNDVNVHSNAPQALKLPQNDAQLPSVDPIDNFVAEVDESAVEFNKSPPENLPTVETKLSDAVDSEKSAEIMESALKNNKHDAQVDFNIDEKNVNQVDEPEVEESVAAEKFERNPEEMNDPAAAHDVEEYLNEVEDSNQEQNLNVYDDQYTADPNQENIYDNQFVNDPSHENSNVYDDQYANDPNQQYYNYNEHYENDPNAQYDQQYMQDPNVHYENQEYPAEYQEYTEYPAENYDQTYESAQNYAEESDTNDPDKIYEENRAPEAINQCDETPEMEGEVESKAVSRNFEDKQSIKKSKDIIKSILDSDTESSMEKNVSNTESDFDFN